MMLTAGLSWRGQLPCHGVNSMAGSLTRSINSDKRTRLTGPCTRNSAGAGTSNSCRKILARNSEQLLPTSRRTACPNWRYASSSRSAVRRSSTSSSSTSSSVLRVTRNCTASTTSRPSNSSEMCARTMLERLTNSRFFPQMLAGNCIRRGSARESLTIATSLARPNASPPFRRTTMFSDLLATCGKGCAGSNATGTSNGLTACRKCFCTHLRCAAVRSLWFTIRMPAASKAGINASLYSAYWRATRSCALCSRARPSCAL